MHIVVCIKQVPEVSDVKVDPETKTLVREGVPSILNPFDEYAVEEALRLKKKHGGEVTVVTMGPPQAKEALKKCLAMGADKAVLISDRKFAGADTLATSYTLSRAISKMNYDVIFCGKQAIDGDTAQVGPQLAEFLGIPQITYVIKVEVDPEKRTVIAHRETDDGYEVIKSKLPVLMTATKGLNEPRLPTVMGIMKASKKEIKVMTFEDLGGNEEDYGLKGSPTQVVDIFPPPVRSKGEKIIVEDPKEAAAKIIDFLIKRDLI